MRHLSRGPHFVVELREARRLVPQVVRQQLEGDGLTESQIVGAVDFAHPSATEQPDDPIAAVEHVARRKAAVADRIG